jgi:hypothetical protein
VRDGADLARHPARATARAPGLGASAHDLSLGAGSDYARAQRFAAWFHQAGFDGVRYMLRNDPAAKLIGVALFGSAGEQDLPVLSTAEAGEDTLAQATRRWLEFCERGQSKH